MLETDRQGLGLWQEDMCCYVRAWVPVQHGTVAVVLNPMNAPDMLGCIDRAKQVNNNVTCILVYSKGKRKHLYKTKDNGEWICINLDWHHLLTDDIYKYIQLIGD